MSDDDLHPLPPRTLPHLIVRSPYTLDVSAVPFSDRSAYSVVVGDSPDAYSTSLGLARQEGGEWLAYAPSEQPEVLGRAPSLHELIEQIFLPLVEVGGEFG